MANDFLGGSWEARNFDSFRQHHQSRPVSRPSGESDNPSHLSDRAAVLSEQDSPKTRDDREDPRLTMSPPVSRASQRRIFVESTRPAEEAKPDVIPVASSQGPPTSSTPPAQKRPSQALPVINVPEEGAPPAPLQLVGFAFADDDFLTNESWRNYHSSAEEGEEGGEGGDKDDETSQGHAKAQERVSWGMAERE